MANITGRKIDGYKIYYASDEFIEITVPHENETKIVAISKSDAIAIAKHFKLNEYDLKSNTQGIMVATLTKEDTNKLGKITISGGRFKIVKYDMQ